MNNEFISTCIMAVLCIVVGVGGTWYMIDSLNQDMKQGAEERLRSNKIGPFDDAIADMAGVPRRPKRKLEPSPLANPQPPTIPPFKHR